jgi:Na+-translocating ferredoxin:NAD+ oxidoreductase RnfG subunit
VARSTSLAERRAHQRWIRIVILYVFVTAIVTTLLWRINDGVTDQLHDQQRDIAAQQAQLAREVTERCEISNAGRAEVNKRGDITKEFLLTAAEARRASALKSEQPWERITNANAAKRYRELAAQIEPLPFLDCDRDGKADTP